MEIDDDTLVMLLEIAAVVIVIAIFVLIIALVAIKIKEKKEEEEKKKAEEEEENVEQVKKSAVIYTPESIFDFMDFEKIEDNMIIQKRGRYLMVIECKGINYDLMSEMEKVSVEQGFISFLNTLRHPVQLYIQTRTVNLERSIDKYRERFKEIEGKYNSLVIEYEKTLKKPKITKNEIDKMKYEVVKQKNLMEYTEDIIRDIEQQSLNQGILNKKYYVVVPCYQTEIEAGEFDQKEVENMAFSELYTRSRAIINSLYACQVSGRILDSEELVELLYMAYNRDEADVFWMDKIKEAGFNELYSTAPDVFEKKLKLLNKEIEQKSTELANEKISEARREIELNVAEKENDEENLINKKAKELIRKHKKYIGEEVAKKAMEEIGGAERDIKGVRTEVTKQNDSEEEEIDNAIISEKTKRGRKRKE